jgi:hypothetical protein
MGKIKKFCKEANNRFNTFNISKELIIPNVNVILINYPKIFLQFTKQDEGVSHAPIIGIERGRHSFCLSYPARW